MKRPCLIFLLILSVCLPAPACLAEGLTLRYVPVTEAAFAETNDRVIGAAPDGRMVLIANTFDLYLWDTVNGCRVPISFPDEEDQALLTMYGTEAAAVLNARSLTAAQREERIRALSAKRDDYLRERGLSSFTTLDQLAECFPHLLPLAARCTAVYDRWALAECAKAGLTLLVDMQAGTARFLEKGMKAYAMNAGRLLTSEGLTDLETGELSQPDLAPAAGDEWPALRGPAVAARLGADGGLQLLLPEGSVVPAGNDFWLLDAAQGHKKLLRIGHYQYGRQPDTILAAAGERYLLLFNLNAYRTTPPVLVDRERETAEELSRQLLPICAAGSGFLCLDADALEVVLLDPASGKAGGILLAEGYDWSALTPGEAVSMIGNGQGLLFCQQKAPLHGYFAMSGN